MPSTWTMLHRTRLELLRSRDGTTRRTWVVRPRPAVSVDVGPLLLEQAAQSLLSLGQRDARHDRLEEAHDDELARDLARQTAAHQVEDLGLVDRTDRARVAGATDVGLVDLEARDGHASAPASVISMANSPRKLSVPLAVRSIVIMPLK